MPILYVVTTNSALKCTTGWNDKGIYLWTGDNTGPGFYVKQDKDGDFSLIYVEKTGKVYVSVNYRVPWDSDSYVIEMLLGCKGWQIDPETGTRIMYRVLEPIEYLFEDYE